MTQIVYPLPHRLSAEIEVKDNLTGEKETIQAQSFVMAFLNVLYCGMSATNTTSTDTSGVSRTMVTNSSNYMNLDALANNDLFGIVVGTGTNAVAITDYQLQTKINHGVGSGQLSYGVCTVNTPLTSGSDRYYEIVRIFTNSSGGDITVNEVGLYDYINGSYYYCIERSLNTFTITNGNSKTVTYRIKVTV